MLVQHVGKKEGGLDKLKGKKIALVYHDSPYGKEPIPLLEERAKMHGFELLLLPVTHPGVEQKATWLQIRQQRPDYVFLWGWGVMNSTAIKEAVATGYPREKMYGVWWSGAEPDVHPRRRRRQGLQRAGVPRAGRPGPGAQGHDQVRLRQGPGHGQEGGGRRGALQPRHGVGDAGRRGVQRAQSKYGKKPLTGEQVRWGLENLALDAAAIKKLGFEGFMDAGPDHLRRPRGRRTAAASRPGTARSGACTAGRYDADQQHPQADDPQLGREVRGGEEDPDARLRQGSRLIRSKARKAAPGASPAPFFCAGNTDVWRLRRCCSRERHRGHLQPRDPRAEGRVAHRARGRHRRAARRQRRRQDHHAARDLEPAAGPSAAR